MMVVIGSGPSGVSCARALLDRGFQVTMVDAGLSLEPDRERAVAVIRARNPAEWRGALIAPLLEGTEPGVRGLPGKRTYGSDYAYRSADPGNPVVQEGVDTLASHALGGLSNLWGANALPFAEEDIAEWPVGTSDLASSYRAVLSFMPLSATRDDLESVFPLFTDTPQALELSPQAAALLTRLRRNQHALNRRGLRFGQSRLAVRAAAEGEMPGCVYCGLCLYGCPHNLIYTSATTVRSLEARSGFSYVPGILVDRFEERGDTVRLDGRRVEGGGAVSFDAERIFIACGAVNTTRLVLESTGQHDREVDLLDSQYFMVPLVTMGTSGNVLMQHAHSLSQLALELRDKKLGPHGVHLLLYTFNDMFRRALEKLPGMGSAVAAPLRSFMLNRLAVIQGYLHSRDSSRIAVRLEARGDGTRRLVLRAKGNADSLPAIRRVLRKLTSVARFTGAFPVPSMLQVGLPGKSYHVGGSFPMTRSPGPNQTDLSGRLHGHQRVHLVDASVFPTVPATNSTFGAMANAFRIGTQAGE